MKIGIKYCGGCNPDYDREALVKEMEKTLKGKVEFTHFIDEKLDLVVVIQGCRNACADLKPFLGKEIRQITDSRDSEQFIKELNSVLLRS